MLLSMLENQPHSLDYPYGPEWAQSPRASHRLHGAHVPHSPRRPSSPLDPHDDDTVTRSQSVKVTATNESICADFLS